MSQQLAVAEGPSTDPAPRYPIRLLLAGIVARTWLWFLAGCIVITLVPFAFGWRAYAVESGSMLPRLQVGDVVIASPNPSTDDLLGRVTVFTDPDGGRTKVHRVTAVNGDGRLTTKGDNNPTADPQPLPVDNVQGMARLLVRWVGLPLIWVQTGQWQWLLLLGASLLLAGLAVARDQEDDVDDDPEGPDDDGDADTVTPLPTRLSEGGSGLSKAASQQHPGQLRTSNGLRWSRRVGYLTLLATVLSVPTAGAAFAATSSNPTNRWAAGTWTYTSQVTALAPWLYWKLDETGTTTTATDSSGNGRTGTYNPNVAAFTRGIVGANTANTPNLGVTLNGTTACINTTSTTTMNAPPQLTEVVWFKTTTTNGGKILGFEMPRTGVAIPGSGGTYDRHLYMDGAGKVWFGVYNGGYVTISSPTALNNGAWHMAAATLGATGMTLWIDGVKVGTSANTAGETSTGWFRAGCGNLGGWGGSWTGGNNPTTSTSPTQNRQFAGSLDEISIWQSVLTDSQIQSLWAAR